MLKMLACVAACTVAVPAWAADDGNWKPIKTEEGISVWEREVPGTSNIEFRGRGTVEAPIVQLTAVVFGGSRATEWMHHCAEAYTIEQKAPDHLIAYNRVASGAFFVSDRDMVMDVSLALNPAKKLVQVNYKDIPNFPDKPVPNGVVRVATLRGTWSFERQADGKVETTYQVLSDPGGTLPQWLVHQQTRDLPLLTIKGLRKQVLKSGYEKRVDELKQAFDWKAYE